MKQKLELPQVGDPMYLGQEKGIVIKINEGNMVYSLEVDFGRTVYTFAEDGSMLYGMEMPLLSYTPYKIVGQTLQRPNGLLKKGDGIWVRVFGSETWQFRFFSHFNKKGNVQCFLMQRKEGMTQYWDEYSIERPF